MLYIIFNFLIVASLTRLLLAFEENSSALLISSTINLASLPSLAYHLTHLLASDASKTRCPALVLSLSVVAGMCAKSNVKKRKMTAQPGTVPAAPTATPPQIHNTFSPTLRYEAIPVRAPRSVSSPVLPSYIFIVIRQLLLMSRGCQCKPSFS